MVSTNMSASREYAKFKRMFVGPIMPKRIFNERYRSVSQSTRIPRPRLEHRDSRKIWDQSDVMKYARPKWANLEEIDKIYQTARRLTIETGIPHEVDHIVPIRHPLVCGLHVEYNLRVITAQENNKKSNLLIDFGEIECV